MPNKIVSVSLLYEKRENRPRGYDSNLHLTTDVNGRAQFNLPTPIPARLWFVLSLEQKRWRCGCAFSAPSTTEDLVRKGIVVGSNLTRSSAMKKTQPGELVFLARPATFFERLTDPLRE